MLTYVLIGLGILITWYTIRYILEEKDRITVNIISICGTAASFFGLAIAFIQIIALKEITELTQSTIKQTKDKLIIGISISDVSDALNVIHEIDNYIGSQKYEIARLKIMDLKSKLIQFSTSEEFKNIVQENHLDRIVEILDIQILNLYQIVYNDEIEIRFNPEDMNKQLQNVSTYLTRFKNQIKYQTV